MFSIGLISAYFRSLGLLRQCYEQVFHDGCDVTSGLVMAGLIDKVFSDPFYLRFQYRPNCELYQRRVMTKPLIDTTNNTIVLNPSSYNSGQDVICGKCVITAYVVVITIIMHYSVEHS